MVSASPEPEEPPIQQTIGWGPGATCKAEMKSFEERLPSPTSVDATAQMQQQLPGPVPIPGTQTVASIVCPDNSALIARCGHCCDIRVFWVGICKC